MSAPIPIHIAELNTVSALNDSDFFVVNQGTQDRKVPYSLLRSINWALIPAVTTLNATDYVLINQGSGTVKIQASAFNIPAGTRTWFYQAAAPNGWSLLNYTGDALLAVRQASSTYATAGSANPTGTILGTWQQTGTSLTIGQIPAHTHVIRRKEHSTSTPDGVDYFCGGKDFEIAPGVTQSTGNGNPHNHGNTWRPAAYVGILCQKN